MTATATSPQKETATIVEALTASTNRVIDLENGVIKNVKLIGFESKNGRTYPPATLKAAVHLYEGAKVNIDHPTGNDPNKPRQYQDRFGVIRSARFVEQSGIYGDLHFNPEHTQARQIVWDAKNNPEALGFSHNALLRLGKVQNGKQVIEQIVAVRSMDLVADPATTTSLFEEIENMDPENTPAAPVASDPKDQIKSAFKQMIIAAIDDSSLDMKSTMAKIKEIMKAQEKLMGGGSSSSSEPSEEAGEEQVQLRQENALLKQQVEQFQAQQKQSELLQAVEQELKEAGLDPANTNQVSELFRKSLLATEGKEDRAALIADRVALLGASKITSQSPSYTPRNSTVPTTEQIDTKQFASRLLS